jgi:TonB family protein
MAAFTPILALYSLEILLLVASAAAAVSLVRVPPRGRLVLWRAVVIACLLLPLAPPRVVHVDLMPMATAARVIDPGSSTPMTGSSTASIIGLIPWIVVAGALLRTVWLGIGIIRLRALSRRSTTAALSDDLRILKQALAPTAEVAWHDDLPQPVTFGARHPVVLLPSRLRDTSEECQRAVVCHELVHVERGDWPATIVEELILTALWFHPAVWWAIGQIQLNREATVDARVVGITGARRAYMEALLAFADGNAPAVASVFARRRQIVTRIRQLSQEVVMSRTRLTFAGTTLAAIVIGSTWSVVSAVPIRTEVRHRTVAATRIEPQPMIEPLLTAATPAAQNPQRTPPPPKLPPPPPQPPPPPPPPPADGKTNPRVVTDPKPPYPAEALPHSPGATVWVALKIGANGDVTEAKATRWQLTIDHSIDDPNYWASKPERAFVDAAEATALKWKFAPPEANTRTQVDVLFTFRNIPGAAVRNIQPDAAKNGGTVIRVGGSIKPPAKVRDVQPIYPPAALAANVQGAVVLDAHIGVDGSVLDASVLRSIPLLDDAAVEAVRQWRYVPTLLNGAPVEVMVTVTVNFSP